MIGRFASTVPGWPTPACLLGVLLATVAAAAGLPASARAQATARPRPSAATPKASARATIPATDAPEAIPSPAPGAITIPQSRAIDQAPMIRDDKVVPAAAEAEPPAPTADEGEGPGLAKAKSRPGGGDSPAPSSTPGGDPADPFALRPDRLQVGKQQVRLSVEVRASSVINLGKEAPVRIVVTNEGSTDAYDVRVAYQLPDGLQFASSEAPPQKDPGNPQVYIWNKSMMAAGGEWSIGLKVVAKDNKLCEHVRQRDRQGRVEGQHNGPGAEAQGRGDRLARADLEGGAGQVRDQRHQPRQRPGAERQCPGHAGRGPPPRGR